MRRLRPSIVVGGPICEFQEHTDRENCIENKSYNNNYVDRINNATNQTQCKLVGNIPSLKVLNRRYFRLQ